MAGKSEIDQDRPLARRVLSDGKSVLLWDDGTVTFAMGFGIKGIGTAREPWAREADLAAGWAFMGEAALFDSAEVPAAVKAIRKAFRAPYHGRPGFHGGEEAAFHRACMVQAVETEAAP